MVIKQSLSLGLTVTLVERRGKSRFLECTVQYREG